MSDIYRCQGPVIFEKSMEYFISKKRKLDDLKIIFIILFLFMDNTATNLLISAPNLCITTQSF